MNLDFIGVYVYTYLVFSKQENYSMIIIQIL